MRRLFFPFSGENFYLDGEEFHHWVRVNRARTGDEIEIVHPETGRIVCAKLIEIEESQGKMEILHEVQENDKPLISVSLAFGLLKGEKSDWVIQKAVELGVDSIWPLSMDNSIVKLDEKKAVDRQKRWQKIAREASQQCGASKVPAVELPKSLADAVGRFSMRGQIWVPHESAKEKTLKGCLKKGSEKNEHLIIIGPEGGFSGKETLFLKSSPAEIISLGDRILRAETAAITALGLMLYEWGHLGGTE